MSKRLPGRITKQELLSILADYHRHFSSWQIVNNDTLMRIQGVLAQSIWFDRLSSGTYRPTSQLTVLIAPSEQGGINIISDYLPPRVRQVSMESHRRMFPMVLSAIQSQFRPPTEHPLSTGELLRWLDSESVEQQYVAYAASCLHAYCGHYQKAMQYAEKYQQLLGSLNLSNTPYIQNQNDYLQKVASWIKDGTVQNQMNAVAEEQVRLLLNVTS